MLTKTVTCRQNQLFLSMRLLLNIGLVLLGLTCSIYTQAQDDLHIFTSQKVRIVQDGDRFASDTPEPNKITLNLRDNTITVEGSLSNVSEYLGYQEVFKIVDLLGSNGNAQYYITDTDHVFAFDYNMRSIIVRKRGVNVRMNSLWFEQFTYLQ